MTPMQRCSVTYACFSVQPQFFSLGIQKVKCIFYCSLSFSEGVHHGNTAAVTLNVCFL